MKKNLNKELQVIKDDLAKRKAAANKLGEGARAEADAVIARLNDAVTAIEAAVEEADQDEEDKTEELQAKMDEVLSELADLRKKTEEAPVETANRRSKIINSTAYAYDFLQMVKNSATAAEFRENAKGLMVKNVGPTGNISPGDAFLPGSMVKAITDGFSGKHRLLELVDWTGLPMFRALYETANEIGAQHTKGTQKTVQKLEFSTVDIRPDIIYKYLSVDKVMLKQCETPEQANVLLEYITKELLTRVLFTVEQGILNGTAPFVMAPSCTVSSSLTSGQAVMMGLKAMDNFTDPVLICTKEAYFGILSETLTNQSNSGVVYGDDWLAKALRVREIIPVNVTPTTANSAGMWLMQPEDYKLVGDLRPDQYNSFNLEYNKEQYLTEIYIGGGSIIPNNFIELVKQS